MAQNSIYKPTKADFERARVVREEFRSAARKKLELAKEDDKCTVALGRSAYEMQKEKYWLLLKARNGKPFQSFEHWMREDGFGIHRTTILDAILVIKQFKGVPSKVMDEIGSSKCEELARVKRDRPDKFNAVLKMVREAPDMTFKEVRDLATTVVANKDGGALTRWTRMEFALREEDAAVVRQALIVAGVEHPIANADTPYALGAQLKSICDEYLTGEDQIRIWKKLDAAGAFTGTRFKLET